MDKDTEWSVGCAAVVAARRMAASLVTGFDGAQEEGRPLSMLQQADMIAAAVLEFDGLRAELLQQAHGEAILREWSEQHKRDDLSWDEWARRREKRKTQDVEP